MVGALSSWRRLAIALRRLSASKWSASPRLSAEMAKIDAAELDSVIAIVSGQRPKNELEAMVICQMAVTHALTMRSFGNLNQSN